MKKLFPSPVSHLEINCTHLLEVFPVLKAYQKCIHFFQKLIDQGFALDDIFPLAHTKTQMLDLIEQLPQICSSNNLKTAPENLFYFLLTVNFFGHEIAKITIKPISSKVDGIHQLHIPLKSFYTLLHDNISFEWPPELDKLFNEINNSLSKNAELAIPNTTHPFYITVDASLIGLGAILFQPNTENKLQVISYNSHNLTTQEQKFSTYDRAKTFALPQNEFIIIGSELPISVFTDHNPMLSLFTREGNLTPR